MPDPVESESGTVTISEGDRRSFPAKVFIALMMITGFLAVWKTREILLVAMLGVLFGLALVPVIDWLEKRHIKRGFGVLIVLLTLAAVMWGLYLVIGSSISQQAGEIQQQFPAAMEKAYGSIRSSIPGADLPPQDELKEQVSESYTNDMGEVGARLLGIFRGITGAIGGLLLVLAIMCYTAAQPRVYSHSILMLFNTRRREDARRALGAISETWQHWMRAQFISMAIIGALTTLALWALGIEAALALGVLAGISEFVPVFGPLLSAIPAVGIAFLEGPEKALWVLVAYLVIQQIESNILTPIVMKKVVEVPPLVTILSGTLLVIFAGFPGLLMAVPLVAAMVAVARTFLGDDFLS